MCGPYLPVIGSLLSLGGSLALILPALRASAILKTAVESAKAAKDAAPTEPARDTGAPVIDAALINGLIATGKAMEKLAGRWTPTAHRLLIGGIAATALGGLLGLVQALCGLSLAAGG